ncbi:phBC6A51 family helix-turn-helix protein [Paenibacillus wulumuqiensis]|uniref:phBC6A51 family helix-turn-helix protein n=1 Tax=Paenibacillus wulumuqiensis TaxID=1567107 RepID=UPI0006191B5B|nr:phBC6A51 family helix-turn-helix protein [Paenibacillus wulumuqiensis]
MGRPGPKKARALTTEMYIAIKWMALPKRGGKTYEELAELVGVHRATLFEWKKNPVFEAELKREMIRNTQDKLPELLDSLIDIAIADGNAAMAKLALQVNGMLTDRVEIETKDSSDGVDLDALKDRIKQRKRD